MTQGDGSSGPEVGGQVAKPAAKGNSLLRGVIIGGVVVAGAVGIGLLVGGGSSEDPLVGAASTTEATSETTVTNSASTSTDVVAGGGLIEPILGWFWKLEAVSTVGVRGEQEFTQALFIVLEFDDSQDLAEMKPRYLIKTEGLIHHFGLNMTASTGCSYSAPEGDFAALVSDFDTAEQIGFLEFDLTGEELTYRALIATTGPEWEMTQSCPDSPDSVRDIAEYVNWVSQGPFAPFTKSEVIEGELELGNDVGFSIYGWTLIPCGTVEKLCEDRP